MKCSLLTLSCALDGELSKERQAELESHLVTCERCRTGMRYLREETERISQLVKVTVPGGTATALLERAKVITPAHPGDAGPAAPPEDSEIGERPTEPRPDPFNLMGIGSQLADVAEPGPTLTAGQPVAPPATGAPTAGEVEPLVDTTPAAADALAAGEVEPLVDAAPPAADAPTAGEVEPLVDTAPPDLPSAPAQPQDDWLITVNGTPQPGRSSSSEISAATGWPPTDLSDTLEAAAPPDPISDPQPVPQGEIGPTPVYMPVPGPLPLEDAEFGEPSSPLGSASRPELAAPDRPLRPATEAILDSGSGPSEPKPAAPDQVEMMQVALEESSVLEGSEDATGNAPPPLAPGELPALPARFEPAGIPPPPSIGRGQDQGWKPNPRLNLGLDDIAAAKPSLDPLAASTDPVPPPREPSASAGARPTRSDFAPVRPAAAAAAGSAPGRRLVEPKRRTSEPRGGKPPGSATPRSWTKTATIAIAALAVFLIGWTLTHHSSTAPTPGTQVTSPANSKPSPAATPTAPPSTAPAITLSGTQSFGTSGSGYQVQNVRYGLHQNGTQLWVVFQLGSGSGAPHITTGFDGGQTLYVEMQGVAPGATVAQPAPGELVTSVQPGQVPGFTGAVYILQLSRAAQVSGYLLPGSPTGTAGERVVLQLQ